jgi:hypothetical protein
MLWYTVVPAPITPVMNAAVATIRSQPSISALAEPRRVIFVLSTIALSSGGVNVIVVPVLELIA